MYKITFKYDTKIFEIHAKTLDMTHPYFVSIKGLFFEDQSNLVITPNGDEARKKFGQCKHILIPLQNVNLIEEIDDKGKIKKFNVLDKDNQPN